jgi:hypothetical protein
MSARGTKLTFVRTADRSHLVSPKDRETCSLICVASSYLEWLGRTGDVTARRHS